MASEKASEKMASEKPSSAKPGGAPAETATNGMAFDERLARLERIVGELEQGGLGLEPAIERYQEGIGLLKECHGALDTFKRRVEELTREAESAMRPFAGDPDFPGEARG